MKQSIINKLESLTERLEEINALLSDPDTIAEQNKFRKLSIEHAQLTPVTEAYDKYQQSKADLADAKLIKAEETDPELVAMADDEINLVKQNIDKIELDLQKLLLPKDPKDDNNIFLEIRAGAGGDEAAIFAGDLFRMYSRYAETVGWKVNIISLNEGEHGGFKEIIAKVVGHGAFSKLKFESGAHRVQRVPETESQGRIHTSAATVAVLPEAEEIDEIKINPADLKVDTFRASGAGGQHVNKTDSAIRITHLPTGVVVECQDERSQHKNRARAMSVLSARLLQAEQDKQQALETAERRNLVGSGDRSERIRTYNFPQGRISDHRINLTLHKLDEILAGNLDLVIEPLIQEHQADLLAELAN